MSKKRKKGAGGAARGASVADTAVAEIEQESGSAASEPAREAAPDAVGATAEAVGPPAPASAAGKRQRWDTRRGALPLQLGFFGRFGLTTLGAALMFLSFATFDIWPLAFVCLVPLLVAVHDRTPRQAFAWGAWGGFVTNLGGFYWISTLLMDFAHMAPWMAWPICALMCFAQGLSFAIWAWLLRRVQLSRLELPVWAIAVPAIIALDFVWPMLFPFYLGSLVYRFIPMVQIAELVGVLGISLNVLLCNLVLYHALASMVRRRAGLAPAFPRGFVAASVLVVGGSLAFGIVRMGQVDAEMAEARKIRIGMVEGNIGIGEKEDPKKLDNNILIHQNLAAGLEAEAGEALDLIVWPETSYQSSHIWGSTAKTDDVLFLELDSLFVPRFRDGILPAMRALEVGFGRRLDHEPTVHRAFHAAAARVAMARGYAPASEVDLMGGVRFERRPMQRMPYPYRCGEQANMHLKCPFRWVPPDDVTFLLPGYEPLQPDTRADEGARTFVWNQRAVRRGFGAPLLYGALSIRPKKGVEMPYHDLMRASKRERELFNVAFLLDEHGRVRGNYKKVYLLMFGEYIPLGEEFPQLYDMIPEAGSFTPGNQAMVIELDGVRIGMMICYEDILPSFSRKLAQLEPQVLINVTNDAWFGKTAEPYQHLALSTVRAVEARTWLLRSTNTGVSAFIDANGRIVGETSLSDAEIIAREVPVMSGEKTLYTHIGDVLGWLALGAGLMLLVFGWRPHAAAGDEQQQQ